MKTKFKVLLGILIVIAALCIYMWLSEDGVDDEVICNPHTPSFFVFDYTIIEINNPSDKYVTINENEFYQFFNITDLSNGSSINNSYSEPYYRFSLSASKEGFEEYIDQKCMEKYNVLISDFDDGSSCREKLGYLFSLNKTYRQYFIEPNVNEELRNAFMNENINLSGNAEIVEIAHGCEKKWRIDDGAYTYRIYEADEQLNVYSRKILLIKYKGKYYGFIGIPIPPVSD